MENFRLFIDNLGLKIVNQVRLLKEMPAVAGIFILHGLSLL